MYSENPPKKSLGDDGFLRQVKNVPNYVPVNSITDILLPTLKNSSSKHVLSGIQCKIEGVNVEIMLMKERTTFRRSLRETKLVK